MRALGSLLPTQHQRTRETSGFAAMTENDTQSVRAPTRARLQKARRSPNLIRLSSSTLSSASSPEPSPLPSPALSATSAIQNPFEDPLPSERADDDLSDNTKFAHISIHPRSKKSSWAAHYNSPSSTSQVSLPSLSSENLPLSPNDEVVHKQSFMRRAFTAGQQKIYKHVDPKTIWSIIDIRELVWPITWKKYLTLLGVAILIAAIVVTEHWFKWIEMSMEITRRNMLPVLIIVIGLEPLMMIIILLVARIPNLAIEDAVPSNPAAGHDLTTQMAALEKRVETTSEKDHSTALVIPCHNSDHVAMKRVLESAYPHFRPQDIFIIDNARTMHPKNNEFREFIHQQHPDINYIWSPIGSKNAAQLVGAMAAKDHEFIMTVDDDVCIPANFRAPLDLVDERTKGVAFPLKATDASGKVPLFMVAWQDCEYRMAGLTKLAESQICGVLFPHGAGWFCERATLIDLISNYHSIDFIAEDVNTGLSMQKMKKLIAFDARCILETEVPTTVFGQGLNWYSQRVRSWEMGRHGRLLAFADRLLFSLNGQRTPWGIFAQKFIHMYSIACIIVDWVRIPVLVTMGTNGDYWRQAGLLTLASVLPLLWFRFVSCRRRKDLRPGFWGSITIPVYKQIYAIVSIIGAIRSVVFYIGGHKKPKTIRQMIKDGDERAFWLDPRFENNPGFLADEGQRIAKETTTSMTTTTSPMTITIDKASETRSSEGRWTPGQSTLYERSGTPLMNSSNLSLDSMLQPVEPRSF